MKLIIRLAAMVSILMVLCILFPAVPAQADSSKESLIAYLADNHYIGRWVSYALDYGGGDIKTKADDDYISRYLVMTIFRDGTLMLEVFGKTRAFELQKTDEGFRFFNQGKPEEIKMQGPKMVYKGEAYDTYLEKCADPVGTWKAASYTSEEGTFPAEKLFPDGCTVNIGTKGYGMATINSAMIVGLYMPYRYGEFNGNDVFFDLKWDVQEDVFQLTYGEDAVVTFTRSMTENGDIPVEPVPSYYGAQPEGLNAQTMKMKLMSIAYPPKGWVIDMDRLYDGEDESRLEYSFRDDEKHLYASMSIKIYRSEALYYYEAIRSYQEIADNTSLLEKQIGGVRFFYVDYEDGGVQYQKFVGREPKANMILYITISQSDAGLFDYQPILDSISFTLPVLSPAIKEPPLPEDSAPYVPQPQKVRLGDREITAAFLPMDTPLLLAKAAESYLVINGGDMLALQGDTLYLLTGRRLYAKQNRDGRLVNSPVFPEGALKLDNEYRYLSMLGDDTLYVYDGSFSSFFVKDSKVTPNDERIRSLAMHPNGDWGISFGTYDDTQLVHVTQSGFTMDEWALHDLSNPQKRAGRFEGIDDVFVADDRVYVAGREDLGKGFSTVAAYDICGNEQFVIGSENWDDPEWINCVTDMVQTQNSLVILDAGERKLKVISLSGGLIGTIVCDQLLGTKDAEILSITPAEDGLILSAAQTREDRSCTEVLVFHITGI